jgi:hypothetical protein
VRGEHPEFAVRLAGLLNVRVRAVAARVRKVAMDSRQSLKTWLDSFATLNLV